MARNGVSAVIKRFEYDGEGKHRIVVGRTASEWVESRGIARVGVGGQNYIGVSTYYEGELPAETVLLLQPCKTQVKFRGHPGS